MIRRLASLRRQRSTFRARPRELRVVSAPGSPLEVAPDEDAIVMQDLSFNVVFDC
jgi:hypothetical protein